MPKVLTFGDVSTSRSYWFAILTGGRYSRRSRRIRRQEVHGIESSCQQSCRDREVDRGGMRWMAHVVGRWV